jgi:hypothetical protein
MPGSVRAKAKWLSYSTIPLHQADHVSVPGDLFAVHV